MNNKNLMNIISGILRKQEDDLYAGVFAGLRIDQTASSTSTNEPTTLSMENIQQAFGLIPPPPPKLCDELWAGSIERFKQKINAVESDCFPTSRIAGVPVFQKQFVQQNIVIGINYQPSLLKGDPSPGIPEIAFVINLDEG